jgi:hypothetical protein
MVRTVSAILDVCTLTRTIAELCARGRRSGDFPYHARAQSCYPEAGSSPALLASQPFHAHNAYNDGFGLSSSAAVSKA